jgi:hypothetical protein
MLLSILLHFMAFSLVFGVLFIAVCPELNFLPFPLRFSCVSDEAFSCR